MIAINPNIANERKTGPVTPEGKAVSRFNALKTGEYSLLLKELECEYCKRRDYCQFFDKGSKCTLRAEIKRTIFTNYLEVYKEAKRLYELALSKGLEEMIFDKETADKWINLATKQLQIIMQSAPIHPRLEWQSEYSMHKEIQEEHKLYWALEKLKNKNKENEGEINDK